MKMKMNASCHSERNPDEMRDGVEESLLVFKNFACNNAKFYII